MTKWQIIEQKTKESRKALKGCETAKKYGGCGFRAPVINGIGECSGCRNPDDNELEPQCKECEHNEYFYE